MSRRTLALAALVALLAAAVFARTAGFGFIEEYDDRQYILDNPQVRAGLTAGGVAWAFTSVGHASNWHPLTWLSHMLDVQLFGLDARGHHLVNILLHAANAALLFLALRGMTGAAWPSAFAAALFAVHPLHVESVAWVVERKDVLSTLFWALALLAWLRYARRPGPARYAAAAGALALGLLAKPMLVTLPFLLLLLDLWPLGRVRPGAPGSAAALGRLALEKLPLLLLSAASIALTVAAQHRGREISALARQPLDDRIAGALVSWLAYVRLTLWPSGLTFLHPWERLPLLGPHALAAALGLAALTALALRRWRRAPWLATGWLWYLGTLVPVIGLVQTGDQALAERYTYVPAVGLFVALAWAAAAAQARWGLPRALPAALGLATVGALSAAAFVQAGYWRDDETLFRRAIEVDPRNWVAQNNLGVVLGKRGLHEAAAAHFVQAVAARPGYAEARYNLAMRLYDLGRLDEAAGQYRAVIRLQPGFQAAHTNLGAILFRQGDLDGAVERFAEAVRLRPDDPIARGNLELALRRRQEPGAGR